MTDELRDRLDRIEGNIKELRSEVQDALLLQARHDEQIRTMQKGLGGTLVLITTVIGAWLKTKLGV